MEIIFTYIRAILLFTTFANFATAQTVANKSQPTEQPGTDSASAASNRSQKQYLKDDAAQLAERDRLWEQANKLHTDGNLAEAIAKCEEALSLERRLFGNEDQAIVGTLERIAVWLEEAEDIAAAKQRLQQVLDIQIKAHGNDDWRVTDARLAVTDLALREKFNPEQRRSFATFHQEFDKATALSRDGKFVEAIKPVAKALAIHQQIFGENHPNTAGLLENLALLHASHGDFANALPLHTKSVAIRKQVLGKNHPDVATSLNNLAALYYKHRDYARALPLFEEALAIRKRALGERHESTAQTLTSLAALHESRGSIAQAQGLYEEALAILNQLPKADQLAIAKTLQKIAGLYKSQGDHARARPLYEQALSIHKQVLGNDHLMVATSLVSLAELCRLERDYINAVRLQEQALTITKRELGENHPTTAALLSILGAIHQDYGDYAQALPLYEKSLEIRQQAHGKLHPEVATSLDKLAGLHKAQGNYSLALPLYERALAIRKQAFGDDHAETAKSLSNLANVPSLQGEYKRALPLQEKALAIRKKVLGENHPDTATSLHNLANLFRELGDYARALPLQERALAITKEIRGSDHVDTASCLHNLAQIYSDQGDYARALPLHEEALAIVKRAYGESHPEIASCLNSLAVIYAAQDDYARALPLFEQAAAIAKHAFGENHPQTAASLNNLAYIYSSQRDFARALPLYEQALAIRKKVLGDTHPATATSLNNVAHIYAAQGNYARALPLYEQALAITRQALGENHPDTAAKLNNLAALYQLEGDYARSLPLLEQALEITKQALGENHPQTASASNNLAAIHSALGDYERAKPLYEQALTIRKLALGKNHANTADSLNNLAQLYATQGDYVRAMPLFQEATEIMVDQLELTATVQSERQQLGTARITKAYIKNLVSCALLTKGFATDVYQQVLLMKGSVLRRQRQARLARQAGDPLEQRQWTKLQSLASRLAKMGLNAPGPDLASAWRRQIEELTVEKERQEALLSRQSTEFRTLQAQARLTPDQLRASLPSGVILVDLFGFKREVLDREPAAPPKRRWESRLAAFILRADSPVIAIDLGDAEPFESAVAEWHEQISQPNGDPLTHGQKLRKLLWEPMAPHLESAVVVLIAPDVGMDQLIPWGALPGQQPGTYLVEERAIAIVSVPQLIPELLLSNPPTEGGFSLLTVGDVDYDSPPSHPEFLADSRSAPRGSGTRAGMFANWKRLSETRPEVSAIEDSFRREFAAAEVTTLQAERATEEAFRKQAGKHRFLHLATHGFFAPPEMRSALATDKKSDSELRQGDFFGERGIAGFHPGLLSGIVLAGANLPPEAQQDDGILTALEVGALDLRNVELVTLSACESGLGEAGDEGMLGLQRAFQIAGARTTVASLWKVNDDATRVLMTEFYKNLWKNKLPRIEALRKAQITMLHRYDSNSGTLRGAGDTIAVDPKTLSKSRSDGNDRNTSRTPPIYWAAFVLSGDWR